MKRFLSSRWFKIPFYTFLVGFALIGFFLTVSYMAIQFRWTNESGIVDANNRYFSEMQDKYNQSFRKVKHTINYNDHEALHRILILNKYFPKNAEYILHAYTKNHNPDEVLRMLDAVDIQLKDHASYTKEVKDYLKNKNKFRKNYRMESVFEWMNIAEWQTFKEAVAKDKKLIDSAANVTGVEPRLIVACLVGEQIRLFNSGREAYKKWIGPLKILSVESQFSFGVTGIKEHTAMEIERLLKDRSSVYYLGEKYEHLLDIESVDSSNQRIARLTSYRNHYYSYLYAAVFLKQVKMHWQRAGFPIDDRPEILVTLFNVGFPQSKPKANPRVGGSTIQVKDKKYSFGAIGYQFYYSGELYDLFPFKEKRFDWKI
ncbi:MAG: hypothetical protein RIT43_218 [Bacteroidota bacterium]